MTSMVKAGWGRVKSPLRLPLEWPELQQALFLDEGGKRVPYYTLLRIVHAAAKRPDEAVNVTSHAVCGSCTTELLRGAAGMYPPSPEGFGAASHAKMTINDMRKEHRRCHPREKDGQA